MNDLRFFIDKQLAFYNKEAIEIQKSIDGHTESDNAYEYLDYILGVIKGLGIVKGEFDKQKQTKRRTDGNA
jgi:hypothetical protein